MITFIIPTKGRPTLKRTIESLQSQTDLRWKAIVVGDNVFPEVSWEPSEKISILQTSRKLGEGKNSGGDVRNYAFSYITTEWVGFVDDDDFLESSYVAEHLNLTEGQEWDLVLHRMVYLNGMVIPPWKFKMLDKVPGTVGISFTIKAKFLQGEGALKFIPHPNEDYNFLVEVKRRGLSCHLSDKVLYRAGMCEENA